MDISVIVVSWNTRDILRQCLRSVRQWLRIASYEVIVVDNASTDGSPEMVEREFPEVRLLRNRENLGFGRGNNVGMTAAGGDFFLLLNSDARLLDDSARSLAELLRVRPEVGVVAPRLVFEDGRLQVNARRFPSLGRIALLETMADRLLARPRAADLLLGPHWEHDAERSVDWLNGACLLVRREVFDQTGGFDPGIFMYGEELEWCRRIRSSGWDIVFAPVGQVLHIGQQSTEKLFGERGHIDLCLLTEDRLLARWQGPLAGFVAPALRCGGAILRLIVFGLRRGLRDDAYGRDVRGHARATLRHYWRRLRGAHAGRSHAAGG